jgi:hypothetical protein
MRRTVVEFAQPETQDRCVIRPCRVTFRAVLACCALGAGPFPAIVLADDSARISLLESEIRQLRIRIDEQNRRILRLEEELRARGGNLPARPMPRIQDRGVSAVATGKQPWHAPEAWSRVKDGMTPAEVTAILGEPTAVEGVDAYKTLFYRGTVAGSVPLSGIVNFKDDRVVAVRAPNFAR